MGLVQNVILVTQPYTILKTLFGFYEVIQFRVISINPSKNTEILSIPRRRENRWQTGADQAHKWEE